MSRQNVPIDLDKPAPQDPAGLAAWCRGWIGRLTDNPEDYPAHTRRNLLGEAWAAVDRLGNGELSRRLREALPDGTDPLKWWQWSRDGRADRVPHLLALAADWCEEHAQPPPPALKDTDMKIISALAESHPVAMEQYALEQACQLSRRTIGPRLKKLRELELVVQPLGERGGHVLADRGFDLLKKTGTSH
jgi:hypothetical protein